MTQMIEGLEQALEPCWYAKTPDGHAFEWVDGSPHWQTEDEAREQLVSMLSADLGQLTDLTLHRDTGRCWHLTCAECGYRYDEDEWVSHFPGRNDATDAADDCDWHIVDGRALCPECA